jgi:CII-binding regulator of phage lambda lysogenization HflD
MEFFLPMEKYFQIKFAEITENKINKINIQVKYFEYFSNIVSSEINQPRVVIIPAITDRIIVKSILSAKSLILNDV